MVDVQHSSMAGTDLHQPGYVQSSDPGAVGANIMWIDTSGGTGNWVTKVRNAADTGWEIAGAGSDGVSGYSGFSGFSGAAGSGGGGSSNYSTTITNVDLSAGVATITHNLGDSAPIVVIYDNNFKMLVPDEITVIDSNTIQIDLTSYAPISGTWYLTVGGGNSTYLVGITNAELTAGVATINHLLGSPSPVVVVYNNNSKIVLPDNVTSVSPDIVSVDLSSFGSITGIWNIRISV